MSSNITHQTLSFDRTLSSPPAKVFHALSDTSSRSQWAPPSKDEVVEFILSDFSVGGFERARCGERGSPSFVVETRYLDIVVDERIVLSEVVSQGPSRLAASLVTMELSKDPSGSQLKVTVQVASLAGEEMIEGFEFGWDAALNGLSEFLRTK